MKLRELILEVLEEPEHNYNIKGFRHYMTRSMVSLNRYGVNDERRDAELKHNKPASIPDQHYYDYIKNEFLPNYRPPNVPPNVKLNFKLEDSSTSPSEIWASHSYKKGGYIHTISHLLEPL